MLCVLVKEMLERNYDDFNDINWNIQSYYNVNYLLYIIHFKTTL